MKQVQGKKNNGLVTLDFLKKRQDRCMTAGFPKQKWVEFCEKLMAEGYKLRIYEARKTFSKYITVIKGQKQFKVRFSNHKPIQTRELRGDCNFFVGVTNFGMTTTNDALKAVREFFGDVFS